MQLVLNCTYSYFIIPTLYIKYYFDLSRWTLYHQYQGDFLKTFIGLIAVSIGTYFGIDYFLSSTLARAPSSPESQRQLVQGMASFLETSPALQRKIASTSDPQTENKPIATHDASTARSDYLNPYFGSTPTDQFFKEMIVTRNDIAPTNFDGLLEKSMETTDYIRAHPQESLRSLERAMNTIPPEMTAERSAILSSYVHASIHYIETIQEDGPTKVAQLSRLIENSKDPEIQETLQHHFKSMLKGESVPSPTANDTEEEFNLDPPEEAETSE
jgi:hypothetical protein